jgi:excisionase family DNA binding protein
MSDLTGALVAALDDADLAALAERLRPWMITSEPDEWLTTAEAAAYLRVGLSTLHRLAKVGDVPAHQDVPGGKYAFRRSELDAWRRGQ